MNHPNDVPPPPASPGSPKSRLAVLLFTDIVGSTTLKTRIGTAAYAARLEAYNRRFESLIVAVSDTAAIIKHTGDGYFATFATTAEAVKFALQFQDQLHQAGADALATRIGIHVGEVAAMEMAGQSDVIGLSADLCARLMSLGAGGQILLTRTPFNEARQFVDDSSLKWVAHGPYRFDGIDEAVEVFEVGEPGIAPLAAPPDAAKARRAVSADEEATLGWRPACGLTVPERESWVIDSELGQGGFGEVWLARHVKTRAPRVFKFCFDPDRLRSFKRELTLFRLLRESLGERRDIAQIFEVRLDAAPYFLEIEYVNGGNLREWLDARGGPAKVAMEDRIDIVARVALAIAAAHSVGVIHKDIKPTNVLIENSVDGRHHPVIADFGIGFVDANRLSDWSITPVGFTPLMTENDSSRTGTRMYAPPESLARKPFTTQGDIYSLGVLLYQMTVADLDRPLTQGWQAEVEDEHLREDIAACVAGEPSKRLGSATELAHRLTSLPARRAAIAEERRLAKVEGARADRRRRYRFAMTLFIPISSILVFFMIADSTKNRRRMTEMKLEEAETQRQKAIADKRFADTRELTLRFLFDFHRAIEPLAGSTPAIEMLVRTANEYLAKLGDMSSDPNLTIEVAVAERQVGDICGDPTHVRSLGKLDEAETHYRAALARLEKLPEPAKSSPRARLEAARTKEKLANLLVSRGKSADAIKAYRDIAATYEQLAAGGDASIKPADVVKDAQVVWTLIAQNLVGSDVVGAEGAYEQSRELARRRIALLPGDLNARYDLAAATVALAETMQQEGSIDVALRTFNEANASLAELVAAAPDNVVFARNAAIARQKTGVLLLTRGDFAGARKQYEPAEIILAKLAAADPTNVVALRDLITVRDSLGEAEMRAGDLDSAEKNFAAAMIGMQSLAKLDTTVRTEADGTLQKMRGAQLKEARGDAVGALAIYQTVAREYDVMITFHPQLLDLQDARAGVGDKIATLLGNLDRKEEAMEESRVVFEIASKLVAADPKNASYRKRLVVTRFNYAGSLGDYAASMDPKKPLAKRIRLTTIAAAMALIDVGGDEAIGLKESGALTPDLAEIVALYPKARAEYAATQGKIMAGQ